MLHLYIKENIHPRIIPSPQEHKKSRYQNLNLQGRLGTLLQTKPANIGGGTIEKHMTGLHVTAVVSRKHEGRIGKDE
jgi:hypothetical protein